MNSLFITLIKIVVNRFLLNNSPKGLLEIANIAAKNFGF